MLNKARKQTEGFTIIEVLIVLAIAGLIMLIVFLAVPALQRNSRNTSRRSEAGRFAAAANEFVSNSNGAMPAAANAAAIQTAVGGVQYYTNAPTIVAFTALTGTAPYNWATTDSVRVVTGATCNGTGVQAGTPRQMAVQYGLEPSSPACQNI